MHKRTIELLKSLSELDGLPGSEQDVRDFIRRQMEGAAEFETDNLGSLICRKAGASDRPRIMVPAHMDEIGFAVKDLTPEGYLRLAPLGGWLDQTLLGHRVTVRTRKGDVPGVIGCTPPHLMPREDRDKVIKLKTMFVDVGAADKKEAAGRLGIRMGDPVVPSQSFMQMRNGKYLLGKAWDDRVCCGLMIEMMRALQNVEHENTVYAVGTVQEEVGTRGAGTSADVVDPDFCIVLDVGLATDMPGTEGEVKVSLGKGPVFYMQDAGTIAHRKFLDFVMDLAEKKKIPLQTSLLEGGSTDGRAIQVHKRGVPCVMLGIPARYIHSHAGIIHTDDFDAALKLMLELVKALTPRAAEKLRDRI
jgi:endoglucanase